MKVTFNVVKENDRSFLTEAEGVLSLQITSFKFVLFGKVPSYEFLLTS